MEEGQAGVIGIRVLEVETVIAVQSAEEVPNLLPYRAERLRAD